MFQQIIALIVILFFVSRLILSKKSGKLPSGEFIFWLVFWFAALVSVFSLKWLDQFAAGLGFSASAINILVYVAVAVLFYLNFRLRLKIEKMDRNMIKIARQITLDERNKS